MLPAAVLDLDSASERTFTIESIVHFDTARLRASAPIFLFPEIMKVCTLLLSISQVNVSLCNHFWNCYLCCSKAAAISEIILTCSSSVAHRIEHGIRS